MGAAAMTSSLGLLSVFADVVILLALVAAVASRRASQLARAAIATFVFACAWLPVGRILRNMEVAAATRAGGPSSSGRSRSTLPSVSGRSNSLPLD